MNCEKMMLVGTIDGHDNNEFATKIDITDYTFIAINT